MRDSVLQIEKANHEVAHDLDGAGLGDLAKRTEGYSGPDSYWTGKDDSAWSPNHGRDGNHEQIHDEIDRRNDASAGREVAAARPTTNDWSRLECCKARRAALEARWITWFDFAVLDALDGHADKSGECWPSIATIARKVGASVDKKGDSRAVRASLAKSKVLDLLRTEVKGHKLAPGVFRTEKRYWLTVPIRLAKPVTRPVRLVEAGDTGLGKPANIPKEHTHEIERREESLRDSCARETRKRFIRFWVGWPSWSTPAISQYRKQAEKIFAAVCRDENDLAAILESVDRYFEHMPAGQFMMNPARFLNEESWKFGPTTGRSLSEQVLR